MCRLFYWEFETKSPFPSCATIPQPRNPDKHGPGGNLPAFCRNPFKPTATIASDKDKNREGIQVWDIRLNPLKKLLPGLKTHGSFLSRAAPKSLKKNPHLPFKKLPTSPTFIQALEYHPCPNKEQSQSEWQHGSHLGSELANGLNSLPSHGFWHKQNSKSPWTVGFCTGTTRGWDDGRSQNNLQEEKGELHKHLHTNKWISGIAWQDLAGKTEADLKREAVVSSNIYVLQLPQV